MSARCKISIRGAVQGVGFRPFVFRLATELGLNGWVLNSSQGLFVEVEGEKSLLDSFLLRIQKEKPPRSFIQSFEHTFLDTVGFERFDIRHSETKGEISALVLPDIAACPDCSNEIFDPANRRYLYPFTNCTNCGPRFSIIESLPYDRQNTTMKKFEMCDECRFEYDNPLDRRFHAQPNACPTCGPHVELWDESGKILRSNHVAIIETADAICSGKIVAIKGLGGFHLVVDARNEDAVRWLRRRKHREEKPFALMFPSVEMIREYCTISELEERLLHSPEAPIVLLGKKNNPSSRLANNVTSFHGLAIHHTALRNPNSPIAPNNPYFGIMLPYTPLHKILLKELGFPIVATSGNISDEPICINEQDALHKLHGVANLFLVHDRPIKRHVDDSVVRVLLGREMVLRRARGYAPLPVTGEIEPSAPMIAVGAHLKNTVALASSRNVFISQHIGDLETKDSFEAFQQVVNDFQQLYNVKPERIVCDMHPHYLSTMFAHEKTTHVFEVQHHYAHVASCMMENQLEGRVLGVSWDGTGYGTDGTIWGGEFLLTNDSSFERVASLRTFRLPGGEKAIKEPRRTALGLLYELFGEKLFAMDTLIPVKGFTAEELILIKKMLERNINSPVTSSAGRLFDAVASLIDCRQTVHFEGQAAMELEFLTAGITTNEAYPFNIPESDNRINNSAVNCAVIDWAPMIHAILQDVSTKTDKRSIAAKFHNSLVEIIVEVAKRVGERRVVLTGGCFQNAYLTEHVVHALQREGFSPYWHQRVPPNDGGIALGQIYAAQRNQRTQNLQQQLTQEEVIV